MAAATRVLVLDRDARRLRHLPRILKREGSDIVAETSSTIADALERVRSGGYDVFFCRVDGPDDVRFLIRMKRTAPGLPVVAVTPAPDAALEDLALESGADTVQTAPF